jgi:hypothetical protein
MKKLYWALLLISFASTILQAQTCLLLEKTTSIGDRQDTIFYSYDAQSHLLKTRQLPYYDGGYLEEEYQYGDGVLNSMRSGNFSFLYFHDDNRVVGVVDYDDLGVSHFYHTFNFDDQQRLIQYTTFETPFLADTLISEYEKYYYEGQELRKIETYTDYPDENTLPYSTVTYSYGKEKSPIYNPIFDPLQVQQHIVIKEVYENDNAVDDEFSHTRSCTFNAQGYPTKCTLNYLNGEKKGTETYRYQCDK